MLTDAVFTNCLSSNRAGFNPSCFFAAGFVIEAQQCSILGILSRNIRELCYTESCLDYNLLSHKWLVFHLVSFECRCFFGNHA